MVGRASRTTRTRHHDQPRAEFERQQAAGSCRNRRGRCGRSLSDHRSGRNPLRSSQPATGRFHLASGTFTYGCRIDSRIVARTVGSRVSQRRSGRGLDLFHGQEGHSTPTGVFTILQKHKDHHSSTYNNAPMPNMNRLTWDGIALHAGNLPGYPASHGCVRLPLEFSESSSR